jgi:hypothetical protein
LQLREHRLVGVGVADDGRERVVLRRRAQHRRAADVDVLDDLDLGGVAGRDRALERVEVDAHEVDELDLVFGRLAQMTRVVSDREHAGVQARVQRLDPAVHDLREAGEPLDRAHLQTRGLELARRAAGRDDLDPERGQALGERHHPALVGDGQQRAPDADLAGRDRPRGGAGGGGLGDGLSIGDSPRVSSPARGNTAPTETDPEEHDMERSTGGDVERDLERSGDELEERLETLDDHIDDARQEATARSEDTDDLDDVAGDWEDSDDASGGEDPAEFDDPDAIEEDEEE